MIIQTLENPDINDNETIQSKEKRPNDDGDIQISIKKVMAYDLDEIDMKLDAFGQRLLAKFDTKIENVLEKLFQDKVDSERKLKRKNHDEVIEHTDEEIGNMINNCRSIDSLEDVLELEDIAISKEADINPGIDG